jgi:hypothetical protein
MNPSIYVVNESDWLDVEMRVVKMMGCTTWTCSYFQSCHYTDFRKNAIMFVQDPTMYPHYTVCKYNFPDSDMCIDIHAVHPEGVLEVVVFREYIVCDYDCDF